MSLLITYFFAAFSVGVVAGLYLPLNSLLGHQLGSILLATAVFFTVGAFTAILAWVVFGTGSIEQLLQVNPTLLLLGVISFGIILSSTFLIPKVSPGAYMVFVVAGQITAGLVLNHYGFLIPEKLPITPLKLFGAFMLVAGIGFIQYVEAEQRKQLKFSHQSEAQYEKGAN